MNRAREWGATDHPATGVAFTMMEVRASVSSASARPHNPRWNSLRLALPVFLITLGAILLAGEFFPAWGFTKTWPLLLIAIGIAKLFEAFTATVSGNAGRTIEVSPPEKEFR